MPNVVSISSALRLAISYQNASTLGASSAGRWTPVISSTEQATNGVILDTANRVYSTEVDIAASATLSVNVASGLVDIFGNALALTRVCEVLVEHRPTSVSTGTITVGGGANPLFATLGLSYPVNGVFHHRDYSLAALAVSTNTTLRIVNNSGTLAAKTRVTIIGSQ